MRARPSFFSVATLVKSGSRSGSALIKGEGPSRRKKARRPAPRTSFGGYKPKRGRIVKQVLAFGPSFRLSVAPLREPLREADFHMVLWRGAGVVERGGLENRCAGNRTEGSNPSLSAIVPMLSILRTHHILGEA